MRAWVGPIGALLSGLLACVPPPLAAPIPPPSEAAPLPPPGKLFERNTPRPIPASELPPEQEPLEHKDQTQQCPACPDGKPSVSADGTQCLCPRGR